MQNNSQIKKKESVAIFVSMMSRILFGSGLIYKVLVSKLCLAQFVTSPNDYPDFPNWHQKSKFIK
jgi:hypothetical protein